MHKVQTRLHSKLVHITNYTKIKDVKDKAEKRKEWPGAEPPATTETCSRSHGRLRWFSHDTKTLFLQNLTFIPNQCLNLPDLASWQVLHHLSIYFLIY